MANGELQSVGEERPAASLADASAESGCPFVAGRRVLFRLDASSRVERGILERWIDSHRPESMSPADCDAIAIPPSRRRKSDELDPHLEPALAVSDEADDLWLAPLRVAWLPPEKDGIREARFSDLVTLGDPRDPGPLRQRWILRSHPDRHRVVVAEPAPVSALRRRWKDAGGADTTHGLAEFVVRQAHLALERAERRLRGARYKVPRFVHEEILARPAFRGGVAKLARELGKPPAAIAREAAADLREIAATHSPYVIDLAANLIRWIYRRGYAGIDYDPREFAKIARLGERYPVVFLPTHKSNLDHLVLQYALHENGHPPNHAAGGINMNFFPVGPLIRRRGLFFIRRSFKDDAVYKLVLRQYIDYLVEKRFPLEWYVEGGRSRSGKLLPPRYGLLAYVIDSLRRGKSEDIYLIPTAIAYDQIQDVGDYVAESHGGKKQGESFGWFLGVVQGLGSKLGNIHIRFGEPLSLAKAIAQAGGAVDPEADEPTVDVAKVAFEVAVRINCATPVTPTSLVALALLGADRALTVDELVISLRNWVGYVRARALPTTEALKLDTPEGIRAALDALVASRVVSAFTEGPEPIYAIREDQHLAAAYYRNTIVHFFVDSAIAELALLHAAETAAAGREADFWAEALRLRDLLKFEFFFADKEHFREGIAREVALHSPGWQKQIAEGADGIHALLRQFRPFMAHRTLRPFLEAYRVVGDELEKTDPAARFDEPAFLKRCLARGRQYQLQRRIQSGESVSTVLFGTALRLAKNRGLLDAASVDVEARRRAFAAELRDVIRRIDAVAALAASRRAGLID